MTLRDDAERERGELLRLFEQAKGMQPAAAERLRARARRVHGARLFDLNEQLRELGEGPVR